MQVISTSFSCDQQFLDALDYRRGETGRSEYVVGLLERYLEVDENR